ARARPPAGAHARAPREALRGGGALARDRPPRRHLHGCRRHARVPGKARAQETHEEGPGSRDVSARTPKPDPGQIREYLLRRMPDSVRVRFEEAYFRDDALLDRIEAEEDVLVTDYVLGRLTETDRRRFEQSLLGMPYYQDRVRTTSQLNLRVARLKFRPPRPREARRPAAEREADRLFPGRTGSVVAFAVLAVLLAAALVTAVKPRSELEKKAGGPLVPALAPAPQAETLVLDADVEP